ncbi:TSUP family transporter [Paracoccus aerodenitrificans]|uniref:TSUP family transporter n=1 Tax=Paracoccus aerodenitrificans TaxID=3017781 RepID=UPI0022F14290|nr:TSUP family transporter [Paracoccus aerodenitrificans]WBU63721.1 TSUP family transporter [Paracoccus aerodenitrificans]
MFEIATDLVLMLITAAFAAGFIDAIAGGGGLITVPALMLAGLPPAQALATNKVQGVFGAATAAASYAMSGHVNLRRQTGAALVSFTAGLLGAFCVTMIPTEALRYVLPVLLIGIAAFFALKPGLSDADRTARITPLQFTAFVVPLIGFYDGLLGPGTGAFFMLGFVMLAGYGILRATAHTKLLNFASNLGGLIAFALVGKPLWITGLAMGAAQIAGAWVGSKLAMRIGARLIKPLLVVTSTGLALKLILDLL